MKAQNIKVSIILMMITLSTIAQVGINNEDPKAMLDITVADPTDPAITDGILIPRIDTFPIVNPGADQNAMIVYLTTTVGTFNSGFYYWNNPTNSWTAISETVPITDKWDKGGNGGTTPGTDFIGTTDNMSLDIRTNNIIRARITTKGQIEILNTGTSVMLGEGAGAAHDNSDTRRNILIGYEAGNDITTSVNNTVVGWKALDNAIDGVSNNVAVGQAALGDLTSGSSNVALGGSALGNAETASKNVVIGLNAMSNSIAGDNNVAIGRGAGANMDADDNVFIGQGADSYNDGTNGKNVIIGTRAGESGVSGTAGSNNYQGRVMIGYEAGGDSNTNNTLFLENSDSPTPLLYGEFDNDILRVNGQLQVGSSDDTTAGSVYAFPTSDGVSGEVLTTDGSGTISWATVAAGGTDTQDLSIDNTAGEISLVDGGAVTVSTIADVDATTKIQVEEGSNDDTIRFDIAGTEHFEMNNTGQLEVLNTGGSIRIGENAGTGDDLVNRRNVLIGEGVAPNVSSGSSSSFDSAYNVGLGYTSLANLTTGASNIAIGRETLYSVNSQSDNVAIGRQSLRDLNGSQNVSIGSFAGLKRTTGGQNVFVGYNAAGFRTGGGNSNTVIGSGAMSGIETANNNTVIGAGAGDRLRTGQYNTIIGANAGISESAGVDTNASGLVAIGNSAASVTQLSNALFISNQPTQTPLLSGIFANNSVYLGGILNNGPYNDNRLGVNVDMSSNAAALTHTLTVGGSVKVETLFNLNPSTAPATPAEGDVYYDAATKKVRVWTGAAWENLN